MKITLSLPLPPPALSPNARLHFQEKGRITKAYRQMAKVWGKEFLHRGQRPCYDGTVRLTETYRIAGKRRHDVRNLFAAFKAGEDGLVDAGILPGDDDSVLEHGPPRIERVKTKAEEGVLVEIEEVLT